MYTESTQKKKDFTSLCSIMSIYFQPAITFFPGICCSSSLHGKQTLKAMPN